MSFLRRLLRRQDGITLVMAVGILGVLTVSGTTLIYYSSTNARSVSYSTANASAYDLAESGINEMMAILSKPRQQRAEQVPARRADERDGHPHDPYVPRWDGRVVRDAHPVGQRVIDVESHFDREGCEPDGRVREPGDAHLDREGSRRSDLHAAAEQPGLELHLFTRYRSDVRHDDPAERGRPVATVRGRKPLPDEHRVDHVRAARRAGVAHDVPECQLCGHVNHPPEPAERPERLQMEEQRASQPLPAGRGCERLRQYLGDLHREQPADQSGPYR